MILQPKIFPLQSLEDLKLRFASITLAIIWWSGLLLLILHHHFSHDPQPPHAIDIQFVREKLPPVQPAPEPAMPTPPPVTPSVHPAIHHTIIKKIPRPAQVRIPSPASQPQEKTIAVAPIKSAPINNNAEPVYQPLPSIPEDLREEAFSTIATARFHIAVDGSASAELIKPSQNPKLNRLLLNAIKNWKFKPAMQNGIAIASTLDIRVHFNVE